MKSVLHVATVDLSLEMLLRAQLDEMQERGWRVMTAAAAGPYSESLRSGGFEHFELDHATRSWSLTRDLRFARELWNLIGSQRPDVVHTHTPKPGVIGRPVARLAGSKVVNTVHGLYAQPSDRLSKRAGVYGAERIAAAFAHAELFQNSEDLETMRRLRVPESKLRYLGNGVDLTRFRPKPEQRTLAREAMGINDPNDVVIGCVARLVREKGVPELVEAFTEARSKDPRLRLALIGWEDDSRDDAYRLPPPDECERLGIHALGFRDDVEFLYQGMDLFALLSHREGFPRSVMEASACGVPVIATDIRGCTSAVFNDRNGFLVPLKNPAAAAERISALGSDRQLRDRLSVGALEVAKEHFDVKTQVDITLGVYEELLGQ